MWTGDELFRPAHVRSPVLAACVSLAVVLAGCSRQYYRKSADEEAVELLKEKEKPEYGLPEFSVYADRRSRFFNPYDPDHPPMPPDDPESHRIMHCVYGMKGHRHWHDDGDIQSLESPYWRLYLNEFMEVDEDGYYVMELADAVQLALLNSDTYQSNLEELYLSALDVAFERFRFDVQFFGGFSTLWEHWGSEFRNRGIRSLGPGRSSSLLTQRNYLARGGSRTSGARAGIQKLLPAGGQFLVDFANTFIWQFSGTDSNVHAGSVLSFTFLQPILRSAGREVALERLTLAERTLLANLRQMARFRHSFLIDLTMGTGLVAGPSRRGGLFGGAGLTGFTGQGTGGFAGRGECRPRLRARRRGDLHELRPRHEYRRRVRRVHPGAVGVGGAAAAGFAAGIAGNVGGFYGLLQQLQQILNQEANLQAQMENLARIEALFEAGRIDSFQVDQFRQNVQTARSQYLSARNAFERSMDSYLTDTLSLPPDLPIRLDETPIKPFQFMEPNLTALQKQVENFLYQVRVTQQPTAAQLEQWRKELERLIEQTKGRFAAIDDDFRKLEAVKDQRLQHLEEPEQRRAFLEQLKTLAKTCARLREQFDQLVGRFRSVGPESELAARRTAVQQGAESLSELLGELALLQAGVRLEAVDIEPVELDPERALQIALANRLDLRNQRAAVVDQWRLIAFNADQLESDLDLVMSGDLGTLDRNIVKFRDQTGTLSVSIQFDAPLTRLGERNIYRQSLIDYQRRRRDYIRLIDREYASLRNLLRQLRQFREELELRRDAMRMAIRTVDQTQQRLREPPRVDAPAAALGPTAVRDLLGALSDLLATQNAVLATYLNYQALRMMLYRDLGVIKFDERGLWIDEPLDRALAGVPEEDPSVPPACPWARHACPIYPPPPQYESAIEQAQSDGPRSLPGDGQHQPAELPDQHAALQDGRSFRPASKEAGAED